jgi:hypothetical protein
MNGFTRRQYHVSIMISGAGAVDAGFRAAAGSAVSAVTGGAAIYDFTGLWTPNGAERGVDAYEPAETEPGFEIRTSIDDKGPAETESVIERIQRAIASTVSKNSGIEWIHVSVSPAFGFHFSVSSMNP